MGRKKKRLVKKTKITALIPEDIIADIKKFTNAANTTESLILVLSDWLRKERVNRLFDKIQKEPLEFTHSAEEIRKLNRETS